MRELIEARQGDTVDEWIVALFRVWPATRRNPRETWEASVVYARVNTPDGDPKGIERAHAFAELIRGRELGIYTVRGEGGRRVRVTVPDDDQHPCGGVITRCEHCGLTPCGCWDGTTRGARS